MCGAGGRAEGKVRGRGFATAPILARTHANDARVNGSADRVVDLAIELGKGVSFCCTSFLNVAKRGGVDNVSDDVALDGLVFRDHGAG